MRDLGGKSSGEGIQETPAWSGGLCHGREDLAWGTFEQARCFCLLAAHAAGGLGLRSTRGAPGAAAEPGVPALGHGHCEGGASLDRAILRQGLKPAAWTCATGDCHECRRQGDGKVLSDLCRVLPPRGVSRWQNLWHVLVRELSDCYGP